MLIKSMVLFFLLFLSFSCQKISNTANTIKVECGSEVKYSKDSVFLAFTADGDNIVPWDRLSSNISSSNIFKETSKGCVQLSKSLNDSFSVWEEKRRLGVKLETSFFTDSSFHKVELKKFTSPLKVWQYCGDWNKNSSLKLSEGVIRVLSSYPENLVGYKYRLDKSLSWNRSTFSFSAEGCISLEDLQDNDVVELFSKSKEKGKTFIGKELKSIPSFTQVELSSILPEVLDNCGPVSTEFKGFKFLKAFDNKGNEIFHPQDLVIRSESQKMHAPSKVGRGCFAFSRKENGYLLALASSKLGGKFSLQNQGDKKEELVHSLTLSPYRWETLQEWLSCGHLPEGSMDKYTYIRKFFIPDSLIGSSIDEAIFFSRGQRKELPLSDFGCVAVPNDLIGVQKEGWIQVTSNDKKSGKLLSLKDFMEGREDISLSLVNFAEFEQCGEFPIENSSYYLLSIYKEEGGILLPYESEKLIAKTVMREKREELTLLKSQRGCLSLPKEAFESSSATLIKMSDDSDEIFTGSLFLDPGMNQDIIPKKLSLSPIHISSLQVDFSQEDNVVISANKELKLPINFSLGAPFAISLTLLSEGAVEFSSLLKLKYLFINK